MLFNIRFPLLVQLLISCFMLFPVLETTAQKTKNKEPKLNKYQSARLAEYAFQTGNYYAAIELYLKLNKMETKNAEYSFRLGECYGIVRDYINAEHWYAEASRCSQHPPLSRLKHAQMLQMLSKYDNAVSAYKEFYKSYKDTNPELYRSIAGKGIEDCKFAQKAIKDSQQVIIEHLSEGINDGNSDFAPVHYEQDKLIFSSLPQKGLVDMTNNENPPFIKLYYAQKNEQGNHIIKEFAEGQFNAQDMHTANGAFSQDRQRFYFTRCAVQEGNNKMLCAIYVSEMKNGSWQEPIKLGATVNDQRYSSTHPNIGTNNRKEEVLFFVSDRPDGRGGKDIWYSIKSREGIDFTPAVNIGPNINTMNDEVTPFYDFNTNTLYFSSDGWQTMGGLDIVKSKWMVVRSDTDMVKGQMNVIKRVWTIIKWSIPENLGYPLNSSVDDFYYALPGISGEGYFVSNRTGGITTGDTKNCCDDIYHFIRLTKEAPIRDTLLSSKPKSKTLPEDTTRMDFNLTDKIEKNKTYTLKNIYFSFDKASISDESKDELNRLADMLKETKGIVVEVSAHTDSIGMEQYNLSLSQKRAETIMNYLVNKGVPKKQLVAKGYGESKPIASNTNPDGSDNMEGQMMNRRAEFKIIEEAGKK